LHVTLSGRIFVGTSLTSFRLHVRGRAPSPLDAKWASLISLLLFNRDGLNPSLPLPAMHRTPVTFCLCFVWFRPSRASFMDGQLRRLGRPYFLKGQVLSLRLSPAPDFDERRLHFLTAGATRLLHRSARFGWSLFFPPAGFVAVGARVWAC